MDLIRHNQVPLKVSIFLWRLLRDKLPTKSNLATYGVNFAEARLCVAGVVMLKTLIICFSRAHHLRPFGRWC